MNIDTRVAICCYQGDANQVVSMMDIYRHHECPITILSPEDSPVLIPGLDCRAGGKRCYIGEDAILRMQRQLRILLDETPETFFLIHDADSIVLDAKLPGYLYVEPDVLWSNVVIDEIPQQQAFYPEGMPHVAFQPPWFTSRSVIEKLLATDVPFNPDMLFIDHWFVQAAIAADVPWKHVEGAISYPTYDPFWAGAAWNAVRYHGTTFVHSVKTNETCDLLRTARKQFNGT